MPDKETSAFMQLFYKNLLKMKDVPKAFNITQKSMRKKYEPYYWPAFVLVE
jgi:CHAT domain-containing protein